MAKKHKISNLDCYRQDVDHPNAGKRKVGTGVGRGRPGKKSRVEKENNQPKELKEPKILERIPTPEPPVPQCSLTPPPMITTFDPPDIQNFPDQCSLEIYSNFKKQLLETSFVPSLESLPQFTPIPYTPYTSISSISAFPLAPSSLSPAPNPRPPPRNATFKAPPPPPEEKSLENPNVWKFGQLDFNTDTSRFLISEDGSHFPIAIYPVPTLPKKRTVMIEDVDEDSDSEWTDEDCLNVRTSNRVTRRYARNEIRLFLDTLHIVSVYSFL
ncbi:hypothetical protein K435DRAFT_878928 [Dendrothele bispora CBS 962.96]|uniref:Uncharacterized protein n=1 Tax=Dendrothele bispora (strain CBS 962.96) TaxID=1314807 RepID=A0A4S8KN28_DENBC|nr:hypothetical protein K435DRAFT_878928 [Dendrothele bispora CBS 962.96]